MSPRWLYWPAAAGGGTPWAPSDLTSLVAWYDAAEISGLNNNDSVTSWNDRSGNSFTMTDGGYTSKRPTYKSNQQNGLPALDFDGTEDGLETADNISVFNNVAGGTIFAVCKPDAVSSLSTIATAHFVGFGYRAAISVGQTASQHQAGGRRVSSDSYTSVSGGTASTAWFVQGGVFDWGNNDLHCYVDGTAAASNTSWLTAGNSEAVNSQLAIGRARLILTSGILPFDGLIGEVIYCESALSTDDRQRLEGYLAWKWGLEGNLPPGHPYENAAP